jgi:hypothetical protein
MIYELELFINNNSDKTEKVSIEGNGFMVVDSVDGSLFCVTTSRGGPSLVFPLLRLKQMKQTKGPPKGSMTKIVERKNVTIG